MNGKIVCVIACACGIGALVSCGEPVQWQPDLDLFPCEVDAHCDADEICRQGECWLPCDVDEDCPEAYRCGELVGDLSGQGVCL